MVSKTIRRFAMLQAFAARLQRCRCVRENGKRYPSQMLRSTSTASSALMPLTSQVGLLGEFANSPNDNRQLKLVNDQE